MGLLSDQLNKVTTDFTNNIQTTLLDKFDQFQVFMVATLWQNVVDLILCFLMIEIYWSCFCLIMSRDKVYLPPFGDAKPMDNLFFLGSFYMIMRLVRANHGF